MHTIDERYAVGALLYSPALNEKIAPSLLSGRLGPNCSIALCLEDTIADSAVGQALETLGRTFKPLHQSSAAGGGTLPKLFVRVRAPEQISAVLKQIQGFDGPFSGFIFPKYSLANADDYNREFLRALETSSKRFCMMPILESEDIANSLTRSSVLMGLKQKIDGMKEYVLNVRVGGNDFCNAFGVRRHMDETIYDILPVSQILCDILAVFSRDYVLSGPVWEYYAGSTDVWALGLKRELKLDALNGFIGKTVIHPRQIPIVVNSLKVSGKDYEDAMEILSWRTDSPLLVGGSTQKERMNEVNTHLRWAKKVAALAEIYGIQTE